MSTYQELEYTLNRNDYSSLRGDTFKLRVEVKDQFGAAKNITGAKIWFTVKNQFIDADNLAVFKSDSADGSGNVTIVDASLGYVRCIMPALATITFPDAPVKLNFDVQLRNAANEIITIEKGTLTVEPDVTRAT